MSRGVPGGWEIEHGNWIMHEHDPQSGTTKCGKPWPSDMRSMPLFEIDPCQLCASGTRWAESKRDAPVQTFKYRLSADEWERDQKHRRQCRAGALFCENVAHHYGQALPDGRVFVDGVQVIKDANGRWTIER